MTDYTKATGSGTMMIRDTGSAIELWIIAGSTSTWINGATYSGTASGSYNYPAGGAWLQIRSWTVSTSQTITFTLDATGTGGLGGPTTLSAAISRGPGPSVPPAPNQVYFNGNTGRSVNALFTSNGTGVGTGFYWQIGYGLGSPTSFVTSDGSTTISGLTPGTRYYFYARGINSAGAGPWSQIAGVNMIDYPDSPGTSVDTISSSSARIVAAAPANDGGAAINAYEAYVLTNNAWPYAGGNAIASASVGTFTATGLARAKLYYYTSRARNSVGWSAWTPMKTFTTLGTVPDTPSTVAISAIKQTSVDAVFSGNSDGGSPILEWQIGYGVDPVTPSLSYSGYSATLTSLQPGLIYYFWARGRNTYGWGPYSPRSTATLVAGAWVDVAGVKKRAVPYVRDAGVWKVAEIQVKIAGMWKTTD